MAVWFSNEKVLFGSRVLQIRINLVSKLSNYNRRCLCHYCTNSSKTKSKCEAGCGILRTPNDLTDIIISLPLRQLAQGVCADMLWLVFTKHGALQYCLSAQRTPFQKSFSSFRYNFANLSCAAIFFWERGGFLHSIQFNSVYLYSAKSQQGTSIIQSNSLQPFQMSQTCSVFF